MEKTRILVLGGGIASLSAIYEITSQPDWQQRYEITLLQQGWRLGGKCASSRNLNARRRNEEHGLHILGGFYHNTFKMLIDCYSEWAQNFPHAIAYEEAFEKQQHFYLAQKENDGDWQHIRMQLPPTDCDANEPGVNPTALTPLALARFLMRLVTDYSFISLPDDAFGGGEFLPRFRAYTARISDALDEFDVVGELGENGVQGLLGEFTELGQALRWNEPEIEISALGPRSLFLLIEMAIVVSRGIIADDIHLYGFDVVNDVESLAWLEKHGASQRLLNSTFVNSGYEWAFAYEDGDPEKKNMAAGVCLRGFLRMLATYHGAPFMHMKGGMGEIVITPIYEVLNRRGVRFRFFQQVSGLNLSGDGTEISSVDVIRQATPKAGADGYEPLIDWAGRRAWPAAPQYDLLDDGDDLEQRGTDFESFWADTSTMQRFRLESGKDFDLVVLGISVAALPAICKSLSERHANWRNLFATSKTSPTIAAQVWLLKPVNELGWPGEPPLLTGFELPLSTWCDMSFLLANEDERATLPYRHLAYFCGPYPRAQCIPERPAPDFPIQETQRAQHSFDAWLPHGLAELMPDAGNAATGEFDPALKPEVYVRVNVNPSDEYVLSPAGAISARFRTDETGVHNLFVVGDWIKTGIDVGAVEVAVTAGMQCSRAIAGHPQYIYGETDFP